MVASVENTVRKWRTIHRALIFSHMGKLKGTAEVRRHNVPSYKVLGNLFLMSTNATLASAHPSNVRRYFTQHPEKRQYVTEAYNKLNNVARELAGVRRKVLAATTIQRHWRQARPGVMNRRRATALLVMSPIGSTNLRKIVMESAFPKPVYGPKTRLNTRRSHTRYPTYGAAPANQ